MGTEPIDASVVGLFLLPVFTEMPTALALGISGTVGLVPLRGWGRDGGAV